MPKRLASALCALLFAACSGGSDGEPSPQATFPIASALLDNGEESTLVTVEVAETPEQHERVLTGTTSLEDDRGVVFVFFEERDGGLPMAETPIPLSIAFFDAEGEILRILDVDACTGDRCRVYDLGVSYMGALAVNEGSFQKWDIDEGDVVRLTR